MCLAMMMMVMMNDADELTREIIDSRRRKRYIHGVTEWVSCSGYHPSKARRLGAGPSRAGLGWVGDIRGVGGISGEHATD